MAPALRAEAGSRRIGSIAIPTLFAVAAPASGRDLRIDAMRGLALWMIFVDHVSGNFLSRFTYKNIGFSDATEIFIFLSGMSAGIAYGRALIHGGWAHAEGKALHRVFQIYVAYLASTFVSFALVLGLPAYTRAAAVGGLDFSLLLARPDIAVPAAAWLYYTPYIVAVLPVYLIFVAVAPTILVGVEAWRTGVLAFSAALWLLAEAFPYLKMPNLNAEGIFGMDPLTWQFLFCLGLVVGRRGHYEGMRLLYVPAYYALAWAVIALSLIFNVVLAVGPGLGFELFAAKAFRTALMADDLRPLRLLHFVAVAYVFAMHVSRTAPILRHPVLRPLVASGQNSLEIFSISVPMSIFLSLYFMHDHPGHPVQLLCNVAGIAVLALVALWLSRSKRKAPASDADGPGIERPAVAPKAFTVL
jgi:hypothetical protein